MKIKNTFFIYFFVSFLICGQSSKVQFDHSVFSSNNGGVLELYYSFFRTYSKDSLHQPIKVIGSLDVRITNLSTNELVINKNWNLNYSVDNQLEEKQAVVGLLKYNLEYGEYECLLIGKCDTTSSETDSVKFIVNIEKPIQDQFSISDIEIASNIVQFSKDSSSIFFKNTLEVVPHPSLIFGEKLPAMYYYAEIYDLDKIVNNPQLSLNTQLYDSFNNVLYSRTKRLSNKNSSIVEQGAIKINKYPTGTYNFVLILKDDNSKLIKSAEKKVFFYNPNVIDTTKIITRSKSNYSGSEFAALSDEELNESFEIAKYIATSDEKNQWEKLKNENNKREFLYNFWLIRDPSPKTINNEVKKDYYNRVRFADKNFRSLTKKRGSLTERGRVLLMFGRPSDIERHPNDTENKPYEIWHYDNIEGGVIFVFADLYGYSDYRLLHSTKRGEIKDSYWQNSIATQ